LRVAARPSAIFVGLSSFQALAMFRRGIFYTFLGVYLRGYLGLSVTETTLFETIPMLLNILFQTFVWGRLTDRLQIRRSLIVAGEILASLGHLLMWYFHSLAAGPRTAGWVIIGGLSVIEIFWSMSNIGWSALISDVYTPAERNAAQGRLASVGGAGRILGALAGGALYDGMGKAFAGWGYRDEQLHKHFRFADFKKAMRFVNAMADLAEEEGHHPDFLVHGWNTVDVTLWTHAIGGLSDNDFILAAKIDALPEAA